jgi:hypothetical protein
VGRRNRDVVDSFRARNAISRESARTLNELGIARVHELRSLRDMLVVRELDPGRYYLDEEAWGIQLRNARRKVLVVGLLAGLTVVIVIVHYIRLWTL